MICRSNGLHFGVDLGCKEADLRFSQWQNQNIRHSHMAAGSRVQDAVRAISVYHSTSVESRNKPSSRTDSDHSFGTKLTSCTVPHFLLMPGVCWSLAMTAWSAYVWDVHAILKVVLGDLSGVSVHWALWFYFTDCRLECRWMYVTCHSFQ
jgi:hypothetical protein